MKVFKPLTFLFIISFLFLMIKKMSLKTNEVFVPHPTMCFPFYVKVGVINRITENEGQEPEHHLRLGCLYCRLCAVSWRQAACGLRGWAWQCREMLTDSREIECAHSHFY